MNLQIEHIPVEQLVPYARNARTHSDEQVAQIAGSIAEFGFVNPILVGDDDVIIAGHGRLMAAHKMGLKDVPVICLSHLSEVQRRALVITDNKLCENAGWNEDLLRLELEDLQAEDFDLELTGFDFDEIDRLLHADVEPGGNTDDDEVPETPVEPISKPGDFWVLGNHRLLCGDATVMGDVERLLDGGLADLTFCDPPYNVDYAGGVGRKTDRKIENDNLGNAFEAFLYDACVNIVSVTKGGIYICMSSSELHVLQKAFGRPLSSGPRTDSRLAVRIINVNTNPFCMPGKRAPIIFGVVPETKVTFGLLIALTKTICIRP